MSHTRDPIDSGHLPPGQRPPKALRLLMGLALIGLLAGLAALIYSLVSSSQADLPGLAQINQTVYPPAGTSTSPVYPGPATNTPGDSVYPGPATTTAVGTPDETQGSITPQATLTPTPFLVDPGELTPNPALFTPWPTFTPLPTPTAASLAISNWCIPWNTTSQVALVQRVIDGVSFEIEVDGEPVPVRYIGVVLPDVVGSPAYDQATRANRRLVEGKWVTLIKDRSDVNQQGQWVRYVLADGVFVNHELIRQGYAQADSFPPDISCNVFLFEAQRLAQAAALGIWTLAAAPTRTMIPTPAPAATAGDVRVVYINPKGEGWQDPNEFAEIRNLSAFPVQLSGWTLSDEKGHKFTFPELLLISSGYCRIYTNQYVPQTCGLSFYSLSAIWDDAGDCAYLRDPQGNLVSQFCY